MKSILAFALAAAAAGSASLSQASAFRSASTSPASTAASTSATCRARRSGGRAGDHRAVAGRGRPVYLYVPPAHQQNWRRYCGHYNACGQPVYFVREDWVRERYVARAPGLEARPPSAAGTGTTTAAMAAATTAAGTTTATEAGAPRR